MSRIQRALIPFSLAALGLFCLEAQDLSRYEKLKEPRITPMAHQKMLVVQSKGDPNVVGGAAFSKLFGAFFKIPGVRMAPPRARWESPDTTPKAEWVGLYALPLPESVTKLPPGLEGVRIETWDYGEVAEILHIGPYSQEAPTIERLHRYITAQGYEITGPHEEEYLKSPGMGNIPPEEYQTVIRYTVRKRE